jgi:hypothetical protein
MHTNYTREELTAPREFLAPSAPLAEHLRVAALPCGGLADVLVRQRDEHAAGHGRGDEARGEVAEVDLEVAERVLGLLLHGGGLVVARGQPRERLLLLGAAREAAQHVVDDVARDVGHARGARAARAGAFALFLSSVFDLFDLFQHRFQFKPCQLKN